MKKKVAKKVAKKVGKGRPTKYRKEYCDQAAQLCALGATDVQLAAFFKVSEVTINAWKKTQPDFLKSLKGAKDNLDSKVERSLFERAMGFAHTDTKFATHDGMITDTKEFMKHYPPDVTAMIFWLKNRQPDKWRDKIDHEVEFTGDIHIKLGGNVDD